MSVDFNPKSISEMFDHSNLPDIEYRIPDYQRAYSWEKETQIKQFIEDLQEVSDKPYYLGHFLLECDKDNRHTYYLIDGQQRLTTVVIFMSCVYYELRQRQEKGVYVGLDLGKMFETFMQPSKFSTVTDDVVFFETYILDNDCSKHADRKSQSRMMGASQMFKRVIREASTEEIIKWYDSVSKAAITTYVVQDKFQATQIFSFQNDRGKGLTELEKLKAEIMHQVYAFAGSSSEAIRGIDVIKAQFKEIFSIVESIRTNEDEVLRHFCRAFYGTDEDAIFYMRKEIKSTPSETKLKLIKAFTYSVLESYQTMKKIEDRYSWESSRIADIQLLDKYHSTPLLFKLYHYHSGDVDFIEQCATAVEKILFKMTFRRDDFRTNNLISIARNYNGKDRDSLLQALNNLAKNGFKEYWSFDESCYKYFEDVTYHYHTPIKYVLWKYENYLRNNKREKLLSASDFLNQFGDKRKETTLDHITPQDPDFTEYTNEFKHNYLNNIGNLSPMGWGNNASKKNHNPASEQYREYYNSTYLSMREIYDILVRDGEWKDNQIRERKERILEFVKTMYLS